MRLRHFAKRVEVEISRNYFGVNDPPDRFVIVTVPPLSASRR